MQTNLDDVIDEVRVDQKLSNKTGNQYKILVLKLSNGYEVKMFPHPAEMAVIESLLEGVK